MATDIFNLQEKLLISHISINRSSMISAVYLLLRKMFTGEKNEISLTEEVNNA
jgi:hypothetical protein